MRPLVYLIGAGPGAPDLISVRGLRLLQTAAVVVYDHNVDPRLLDAAPATAERLDVGSPAPQSTDQEAICLLLAEKAREGKIVARLKWGDPFVFDRGGAEALFLHEQQIPFEVIPGIPAAIGIPAFAGIPVTYAGGGNTLLFVRGHEDDGKEPPPRIDWATIARLEGTIVCYAGPRQLPKTLEALLSHGRSASESAAIIINGTRPSQRTVTGTLGELGQKVIEAGVSGPALLVVGQVVGLREHLRWFDNRPLFGTRVLVTRSREQAGDLIEALEPSGADVVHAPVLRIVPPSDFTQLDEAAAGTHDWIVFASPNGVSAFMDRFLGRARDIRALGATKVCAVGPGTVARLTRFGLEADLAPDDYRAGGVVRALVAGGMQTGARVLLATSDLTRDTLGDDLQKVGAVVSEVVAYHAVAVESDAQLGVYRQLLDRRIDVVTFTSAATFDAFLTIHGTDQAVDLLSGTTVATMGPGAVDAAARVGIRPAISVSSANIPAFVEAIASYVNAHPRPQR